MSDRDYAAEIERFVRETFAVADDDPNFGRDSNLFDGGYVDSIGLAELLGYVEDEFGLEVPEDDLISDEFATIDGMDRVLRRLSS